MVIWSIAPRRGADRDGGGADGGRRAPEL